jgi:hypothetical protein
MNELCHLHLNLPQIMCLTEHNLNQMELSPIHIPNYLLGSYYCRKDLLKGGVFIFIYKSITFSIINLDNYGVDQDIESNKWVISR